MDLGKQVARLVAKEVNKTKENGFKNGLGGMKVNFIQLFNGALKEQGVDKTLLIDDQEKPIEVKYKTSDEKTISANIFLNGDSKKWIVGLHGYSSSKESMIYLIWMYKKMGYNLMVFDFRHHGDSDVDVVTFGLREKLDLIATLKYINENYEVEKIGLVGASMGAFTLNYFALSEPELIKKYKVEFGISDSAYSGINNVLPNLSSSMLPGGNLIKDSIMSNLSEVYKEDFGVDLLSSNLEGIIENNNNTFPILFLHSKKDKVTNYQDSLWMYEKRNNPKDEITIFETGNHVKLLIENKEKYIEVITNFVKNLEK